MNIKQRRQLLWLGQCTAAIVRPLPLPRRGWADHRSCHLPRECVKHSQGRCQRLQGGYRVHRAEGQDL